MLLYGKILKNCVFAGLYDVVGNVWEWTATEFSMPKRIKKGPRNLTQEFAQSDWKVREYTVKGGSFVDSRDGAFNYEARCAARYANL